MGVEEIAERLARTASALKEGDSLLDYALVYQRWFPEKDFNLESFKNLPRDIIKIFAVDLAGKIIKEFLEEQSPRDSYKRCVRTILLIIINSYHVDLVDIGEEVTRLGFSKEDNERVIRLLL